MNQTDLQGETERALRALTCTNCANKVPLRANGRHVCDCGDSECCTDTRPCTSLHAELLPLFNAGMEQARIEGILGIFCDEHRVAAGQALAEGHQADECPVCEMLSAVAGAYAAAAKIADDEWKLDQNEIGPPEFKRKYGTVEVGDAIRALTPADARQASQSKPLFVAGEFTSHSGLKLPYKIDCDALTDRDIESLAQIISRKISFSRAIPVPSGGNRLASALHHYREGDAKDVLIVDDVLTTGRSIDSVRMRETPPGGSAKGVVIVARGSWPEWVTPLFVDSAAIASAEAQARLEALKEFRDRHDLGEQLCVIDGSKYYDYASVGSNYSEKILNEMISAEETKLAAARTPDSTKEPE